MIRPRLKTICLTAALVTGFAAATLPAPAQTGTPVVTILLANNGSEGGVPYNGLIQASDGNLYGTNQCFGDSECITATGLSPSSLGNIFRITPAGVYSDVYTFSGGTDGSIPQGLVEAPDGNLYGASTWGGAHGFGNVFRFNLSTHALTPIYAFTNGTDTANPLGTVIYGDDGYLYGTTVEFANQNGFGALWAVKTDGTGFHVLWSFGVSGGGGAGSANYGTYPQDGVTKVGANLFGTSKFGGGGQGPGVLWSVNTSGQGVVLKDFVNSNDGGFPIAAPKVYSDGFLYGVTYQCTGNSQSYYGSVYKAGQSSGFTSVYADPTPACYDGRMAFDSTGNAFFGSTSSGSNSAPGGALLDYKIGGTTVDTVYTFPSNMTEGLQLDSQPFIDNEGRVWTEQYDDGSDANPGSIVAFDLSPAEAAPITITATPDTVAPNTNTTIAWKSTNAFSSNEQVCFATPSPTSETAWSGLQSGSYSKGVLSGSKAISFAATGDYVLAITCGGSETALVTVHVRDASATILTATPSTIGLGGSTTFQAEVTGNGSGATGIVTLSINGKTIGTINLANTTTLAYTATGLAAGTYTVDASYAGDIQYDPSTGMTSLTITNSGPVATTTGLTVSPNPVGAGQNVTFTATVKKASGSGTPTGTVTFKSGSTTLATAPVDGSGVASLTASTNGYPNGTYPIVATYSGDANDQASTSPTVNASLKDASTTALTITPSSVKVGGNVTLKATVSATAGGTPSGSVNFVYNGSTLVSGTLSGGVVSLTVPTTGYPAGTYSLTAVYTGDSGHAGSTSSGETVTLTP